MNPLDKFKGKPINYIVGYFFFLILGLTGLSFQMYKYIKGTLDLVSDEYWINPELILSAFFMMLIIRPMVLINQITKIIKSKG